MSQERKAFFLKVTEVAEWQNRQKSSIRLSLAVNAEHPPPVAPVSFTHPLPGTVLGAGHTSMNKADLSSRKLSRMAAA